MLIFFLIYLSVSNAVFVRRDKSFLPSGLSTIRVTTKISLLYLILLSLYTLYISKDTQLLSYLLNTGTIIQILLPLVIIFLAYLFFFILLYFGGACCELLINSRKYKPIFLVFSKLDFTLLLISGLVFFTFRGVFIFYVINIPYLYLCLPIISAISCCLTYSINFFYKGNLNLNTIKEKLLMSFLISFLVSSLVLTIKLYYIGSEDFYIKDLSLCIFILYDFFYRLLVMEDSSFSLAGYKHKGITLSMDNVSGSSKPEPTSKYNKSITKVENETITKPEQDIINSKNKDLSAINKQITGFINKLEKMKTDHQVDPSIEKSTNKIGVTAPADSEVTDEKLEHLKKVVEVIDEAYGRQSQLFNDIVKQEFSNKEKEALSKTISEHEKLVSKYENMWYEE